MVSGFGLFRLRKAALLGFFDEQVERAADDGGQVAAGHGVAEKVAGEAREFRHPPSPLQLEVDTILKATAILLVPMAILMLAGFVVRGVDFTEAAQTATAGLITLIPEGLVLLMSVTLAVAAIRLARMDTLVQQISATEALAAVDTVCVDKTGTLTDGTLELVEARVRVEARVQFEVVGLVDQAGGEAPHLPRRAGNRHPDRHDVHPSNRGGWRRRPP